MKALTALLLLSPLAASAHVVPDDVRIQAFLKPDSGRMTILVRMPANALIDILFPTLPGSGSLDLKQVDGFADAGAQVWIADLISIYEDDRPLPPPRLLASRISPVGDLSFNSFGDALKHMQSPHLPPDTLLSQDDAAVDALLEIPIQSVNSRFSLEPRFGRVGVRVTTTLAFLSTTGAVRHYTYEGDPATFDLNPTWIQAVAVFVKSGFARIPGATDDLLFLFCLAFLARRFRSFAIFAAAEAFAIICCAEDWVPATPQFAALIATLAAAAIVYLAIGIITSNEKIPSLAAGLIFGANSWLTLSPVLQFGGAHRQISLLAFSVGLALAQLGALALFAALHIPKAPRTLVIIVAAIALRVSWHRMIESAQALGTMASGLF